MRSFILLAVLSVMFLVLAGLAQKPATEAEDKPPLTLLQALHCLDSNEHGWLHRHLRTYKDVQVSFSIDTEARPELVHWTIVVHESELRGHFFEVVRENNHGTMTYRLLDSDGFTTRAGKLKFDEPRLFHTARSNDVERRIQDALQNRDFTVSADEIQYRHAHYTCDCK